MVGADESTELCYLPSYYLKRDNANELDALFGNLKNILTLFTETQFLYDNPFTVNYNNFQYLFNGQ